MHSYFRIPSLVRLAATLLFAGTAALHATNLLTNGDFESTFSGSGIAANWTDNSASGVTMTYSAETAWPHKDAAAQSMSSSAWVSGKYAQFKHAVTIENGHSYRVKLSLKSDQTALPVRIQLRRLNTPYKSYIERSVTLGQGWQNVIFEGSVDGAASSESALFMIRYEANAQVWIDDASLEDLGVASLTQGGFEAFTGGLADGWNQTSSGTVTYSQEASLPNYGSSAQKIVLSSGSTTRLYQSGISVAAEDVYRIGIALRASATGSATLQLTDSSNTVYAAQTIPVSTDWTIHDIDLLAPVTDATARIALVVDGAATLWVDDVSLVALGSTMLTNGTFEGAFTDGAASSWTNDSGANTTVTLASDTGENSTYAQKLTVTDTLAAPAQLRSQSAPDLIKGHAYRYQFSVKSAAANPAMIEVQLRTTNKIAYSDATPDVPGRTLTAELTTVVRPTTTWQTFAVEGVVMEDVVNASIIFRQVEPGTLWVDNVFLVDLGEQDQDLNLAPLSGPINAQLFGMHVHTPNNLNKAANDPVNVRWPSITISSLRQWDSRMQWPFLKWTNTLDWKWERLDWYHDAVVLDGGDEIIPLALSPVWATARGDEESSYNKGFPYSLGWAAEPTLTSDWQDYVETVAAHTSTWDDARYFEVWNEVNQSGFYSGTMEKLTELVSVARTAIKAENASNKLVSPSVIGSPAFLDRLHRASYSGTTMAELTDVISYHFYTFREPEFFLPQLGAIKTVVASNPDLAGKPLWNTESGLHIKPLYPPTASLTDPVFNTALGADLIARTYVLHWASGVARSYYYAWDNGNLGLFDLNTNTPKTEVVNAYDSMRNWLVGKTMTRCWRSATGVWVAQLLTATSATEYIVWHPDATTPLDWPIPPGITTSTTRANTTTYLSGSTLPISTEPILLQ